jgi:hypothetical protein
LTGRGANGGPAEVPAGDTAAVPAAVPTAAVALLVGLAAALSIVLSISAPGDAVAHSAHPAHPAHPAAFTLPLAWFPDGPPARVTGGFDEDTCAACHFTFDDAPPAGRLEVAGLPDCYRAGDGYDLAVTLEDPDMVVAGFQLAVRVRADATQAGELAAGANDASRVTVQMDRGVAFAQHTLTGSTLTHSGQARWRVRWTAPSDDRPVVLHAAALAGDGDLSQEGDRTYSVTHGSGGKACR